MPLISDRPSFATQSHGLEPDAGQRLRALEQLAVDPRTALADERQREVRERCEVAGGADGAARRHERQHAAVQALEQQLHRLDPRPRVALRERVRAQEHRRAHDCVGVRLADAARVRAEQPQLQLLRQLLGDLLRDETAEARVHAVGVLVGAVCDPLDDLPRRPHVVSCALGERRGRAPFDGDRPDVLE